MAAKGARVHIYGDYDGSGVKKASKDLTAFEKQSKGFGSAVSKGLGGIGAAVGGALAFGTIAAQLKDMASAAIEDEKSVVALSKTMSNLGMGFANAGVEDFISKIQLATGTADDQLRPAMARLLRSTGDVAQAQQGLTLALDISAGTGKDLETVTTSLGKAYSGNTTALGRLGLGLDKNLLKSGNMQKITAELSRTMGGQAAAAADTYGGKLQRLSTATDEAKEKIGYALLKSLDDLSNSMGGTDGAIAMVTQFGDQLAEMVSTSGDGVQALADLAAGMKDFATQGNDGGFVASVFDNAWSTVWDNIKINAGGPLYLLGRMTDQTADATDQFKGFAAAVAAYNPTQGPPVITAVEDSAVRALDAVKRLKDALAVGFGGFATKESDRLALQELKKSGPDKSGRRKGADGKDVEFSTKADVQQYAIQLAGAFKTYAADFKNEDKQRQVLTGGQDFVASMLRTAGLSNSRDYASKLIGLPEYMVNPRPWEQMYDNSKPSPQLFERYNGSQGTTYNIAKIEVTAGTPQDAIDQAAKAARLKALGRGSSGYTKYGYSGGAAA